MKKRKTHFEQIPVELVKRVTRTFHDADDAIVISESPATKTDPYATAVPATRTETVAHPKRTRQEEKNG